MYKDWVCIRIGYVMHNDRLCTRICYNDILCIMIVMYKDMLCIRICYVYG